MDAGRCWVRGSPGGQLRPKEVIWLTHQADIRLICMMSEIQSTFLEGEQMPFLAFLEAGIVNRVPPASVLCSSVCPASG